MKRLFAGCLLTLAACLAHGASLSDAVRAQLTQAPVLRGEFEQTKTVVGFKKPLVSRGDFLVVRELGVVWRTRTPFASVLKLSRDEIVATQGGEVAFRLSASQEPAVRVIHSLLFSLLNGDVSGLAEQFTVDGSLNGKSWHLVLTPKQAGLGKLMHKVDMTGDQYVRHIDIDEANGDHTHIAFTAQSATPATLSADEASRFD